MYRFRQKTSGFGLIVMIVVSIYNQYFVVLLLLMSACNIQAELNKDSA